MKKILLAGLFATIAGALVFGAAASLTVNSNDLGSGTGEVASCDTDGVDVSYGIDTADPTLVDTVTVSGIDPTTCAGQTVHISVVDGSAGVLHTDSAAVAASVEFAGVNQSAEAIEDVAVTITGVNP